MSEWQPIETAPKDGASFLAWFADEERVDWCHWQAARYPGMPEGRDMPEGWRDGFITVYAADDPRGPSHWMPIPAPPKE